VFVDNIFGSYILDSRASIEFNYESSKNKLVNLELGIGEKPGIAFTTPEDDQRGDATSKGRLLRLAGWIDMDSKLSVRTELAFLQMLMTDLVSRSAVLERSWGTFQEERM
jgi:DNA mismatch repair protein MSH5